MSELGRSIELFFHDGDPEGMTTATIPFQWTGHVLVTSRTQVVDALREPETAQPGIYLLSGEKDGTPHLYVGETDEIRARIKQHISQGKKDWWERAIFVTATGEPLNKAHSRYLESRIYRLAKNIGKVNLENGNAPTESLLSKAARAHMEDFLRNLRLVLPALRFDFLIEDTKSDAYEEEQHQHPIEEAERFVFRLAKEGIVAHAAKRGGQFVVQAGSDVRSKWVGTSTRDSSYARLHEQLVSRGIIAEAVDPLRKGNKRFTQNYAFNSVSAAASVVAGRPTSGNEHWYLEEDQTVNFGEYERSRVKDNVEEIRPAR